MGADKADFNPYEILELPKNCTEKDIQKAYKVQCLKWHPDKNRNNEENAKKKFLLAQEAFQLLYDKETRNEYDRKTEAVRVRKQRESERLSKSDEARKRHIQDLKEREDRLEQSQKKKDLTDPVQLERLRKQKMKRVREEMEKLRKEAEEEMRLKTQAFLNTVRAPADPFVPPADEEIEKGGAKPENDFESMSADDLLASWSAKAGVENGPEQKKIRR